MAGRWRELFASSVVYTAAAILPMTSDAAAICPSDPPALARLVSVEGSVEVNAAGARLGTLIHLNDTVRVGPESRAAIVLCQTDTVLRVDQNTVLRFEAPRQDRSLLRLIRGAVYFFTQEPQTLDFETPFVNAGVKGTEFVLRVDAEEKTTVIVIEGAVQLSPVPSAETTFEQPHKALVSGQSAEAIARELEDGTVQILVRDTVVDQRQAVQWAIYYQPVLAAATGAPVPDEIRRASDLLRGGRLTEARRMLENYEERSEAHALLAVIAVAQNDATRARVHATRAVELDPESAPAHIALSYALQASFRLEAARDAVQSAVALERRNAFAWARLAELQMSLGELSGALQSAREAQRLSPELARSQIVLGFAALAHFRLAEATEAFQAAIILDSQDPLARLGLGLARIRQSELSAGRRELEIAVALDPANALLRSYLGKAYFEERRARHAAIQLELAKKRDPNDPTPWFYDAILKQTENRPVEALWDIQDSIDKNDNRAVYRSRLLLDEDLAARGTSLGRIYGQLGFDQIALTQGTQSLGLDPANYSAHRFLSDTYARLPRHEIARASELLQSKLLQPTNINPVQTRLTEIDLNILRSLGPATTGFNEFTPLFQRNGVQFIGSLAAGNNETFGDEVALSGIEGPLSFSVSQFHFETDGFRVNNDVQHDLVGAFAQLALPSYLDIQIEYTRRLSDQGDLRLNFDPDDFSPFNRRRIDRSSPRVGLHFAPSRHSDFVASFIYVDRTEEVDEVDAGVVLDSDLESEGYDVQAQYLYRAHRFNAVAGGGISDIDSDRVEVVDISGTFPGGVCPPFPPFFGDCTFLIDEKEKVDQNSAYLYANLIPRPDMIVSAGFGYDSLQGEILDVDRFSPKAGAQWSPVDWVRLRGAYMKGLKRNLILEQTLEPTNIAGFNQFFDDLNGTKTERYGFGVDFTLPKSLYAGVEWSRRNLDVPRIVLAPSEKVVDEDQEEQLYRAYLYWAPKRQWSFRAEYHAEEFKRDDPLGLDFPRKVETWSVPVGVQYFRGKPPAAGFFAEVIATYVDQTVDLASSSTFAEDDDQFTVVDTAIGYRFSRRRGAITVGIRNLFDKDFLFQDSNIQEAVASNPRFVPERTVMGRVTLNF